MSEDRPIQRGDLVRLRNLGRGGWVSGGDEAQPVYMLVEHVYTRDELIDSTMERANIGDARVMWFDADRRLQVDLLPSDLLVRVIGCDDRDPSITLPDPSGPEPTF